MNRFIWLGAFALLSSPLAVWSQEPGSRIRVTDVAGTRHVGTLVTAGDTVVMKLDRGQETVAYPVASLSRFEVSGGRSGHTGTGALLGFVVGAGAGAVLGRSECGSGCTGEEDFGGLAALLGAGIGGGIGLVVGAVAGSSYKTDDWVLAPVSGLHVSAWPAGRRGLAVALSFKF